VSSVIFPIFDYCNIILMSLANRLSKSSRFLY